MYCILFLLEGSISRRPSFDPNAVVDPDAEISWKNRLKIFYDTYLLEHSVGNALLYDSNGAVLGKCVFSGDSGDHEALHFGSGKNAADFNLLDVNTGIMSGQVEFKH